MNRNFFSFIRIYIPKFFYHLGYCINRIFFLKKLGALLLIDFIITVNRFNFIQLENIIEPWSERFLLLRNELIFLTLKV